MQKAMLDLLRTLADAVVADEATADELALTAASLDAVAPHAAVGLRAAARRYRVKAIKMRARGAALGERYDRLGGPVLK